MRLYPDLYGRRFAWMLADLPMLAWIYLCVKAGLWVNNLVLQLDALAQGVINAGKTFDSWHAANRYATRFDEKRRQNGPRCGERIYRVELQPCEAPVVRILQPAAGPVTTAA